MISRHGCVTVYCYRIVLIYWLACSLLPCAGFSSTGSTQLLQLMMQGNEKLLALEDNSSQKSFSGQSSRKKTQRVKRGSLRAKRYRGLLGAFLKSHQNHSLANVSTSCNLVKACDEYTRLGSNNSTLVCENGLMARSGAEYLRTILPSTLDKPGLAKLRILDRFTLTSGKNACNFTSIGDGRHFYDLDYLILRALAEGSLHAIGSAGAAPSAYKTTNTSKASNNSEFIVSHTRATFLAESRDIGHDLDDLFQSAFNGRHVSFIGDSTTAGTHHQLAAWLLATNNDNASSFDYVAAKLLSEHKHDVSALTSEAAARVLSEGCGEMRKTGKIHDAPRCGYIKTTFCKHQLGCSQELEVGRVRLSFTAGNGALVNRPDILFQQHREKFTNESNESIVFLHGGLHYFHLFPVRSFEGLLGLNLGKYLKRIQKTIDAVRRVVGPSGLVVWSTIGNVCDEKYTGKYGEALSYLKDGIRNCRKEKERQGDEDLQHKARG